MPKWLKKLWDDDWYAPCAIAIGLFFLYRAGIDNRWTIAGWPRPSLLSAVFGLVFAIGKYTGMPGARWWGIPWLIFLIVATAIDVHLKGWTAWGIFGLVWICLMLAHFLVTYFTRWLEDEDEQDESEENDGKPFLSLVLLFRESPYLDAEVLARLATKAWGIPVSGSSAQEDSPEEENESEDDDKAFIVGDAPLFMGKHPNAFVIVHHFDRQYFDDSAAAAEDMVELRLRKAIEEHSAWTAVDVVRWMGDEDDAEAGSYRLVARLLAELADENVLAVFDPDAGMLFAYDPETERKLRSDDPRAELREQYYSPVIRVPDDDPAMLAAVAEARARWPEFVAAFEQRDPDAKVPYIIKAPIGPEGGEEFIWIEVTGIESDIIYGTLGNEPAAIPNLKMGDRVRVPLAKLNDWFCVIDGQQVGGFTLKVIADHAKGQREEEPDEDADE